jgi:hypothetical protein
LEVVLQLEDFTTHGLGRVQVTVDLYDTRARRVGIRQALEVWSSTVASVPAAAAAATAAAAVMAAAVMAAAVIAAVRRCRGTSSRLVGQAALRVRGQVPILDTEDGVAANERDPNPQCTQREPVARHQNTVRT